MIFGSVVIWVGHSCLRSCGKQNLLDVLFRHETRFRTDIVIFVPTPKTKLVRTPKIKLVPTRKRKLVPTPKR